MAKPAPATKTGTQDRQPDPARPDPARPDPAGSRPEAVFSVTRLTDGRYQARRVQAGQETRISEPTVYEALAYRYLSGAVQDYWASVCRDRALARD